VSYIIETDADGDKCIQCMRCGRISYNAGDISNKYCAGCKAFHEDMEVTRLFPPIEKAQGAS
jgi:hypothetical protein